VTIDMDAIQARADAWAGFHPVDMLATRAESASDVPVLLAEIRRLRAEATAAIGFVMGLSGEKINAADPAVYQALLAIVTVLGSPENPNDGSNAVNDDDLYAFESVDPQPSPTCFCGGDHFTGWCLRTGVSIK